MNLEIKTKSLSQKIQRRNCYEKLDDVNKWVFTLHEFVT